MERLRFLFWLYGFNTLKVCGANDLNKVFLLCFASLLFLMGCAEQSPGIILVKNIDQNIDVNVTGVDQNYLNSFFPLKDENILSANAWNAKLDWPGLNLILPLLDQNVDNDLTIQTTKDLTVIGPSGAGVALKSDTNRICFPSDCSGKHIDWNGTALVITG
jgi:hypothetical protein